MNKKINNKKIPSEFTMDVKSKRNYQKSYDRFLYSGFYDECCIEDDINDFNNYIRNSNSFVPSL